MFHGPIPLPDREHGYEDILDMVNIIDHHRFENVNAQTIVQRILARSSEYLERQKKKGIKAETEAVLRAAETGQN